MVESWEREVKDVLPVTKHPGVHLAIGFREQRLLVSLWNKDTSQLAAADDLEFAVRLLAAPPLFDQLCGQGHRWSFVCPWTAAPGTTCSQRPRRNGPDPERITRSRGDTDAPAEWRSSRPADDDQCQ